jgi:hypothetical protein
MEETTDFKGGFRRMCARAGYKFVDTVEADAAAAAAAAAVLTPAEVAAATTTTGVGPQQIRSLFSDDTSTDSVDNIVDTFMRCRAVDRLKSGI